MMESFGFSNFKHKALMRLASKLCAHTLRLGLELDLSRQQVTSIKEQHRASPPEDAAFYVLDVRACGHVLV